MATKKSAQPTGSKKANSKGRSASAKIDKLKDKEAENGINQEGAEAASQAADEPKAQVSKATKTESREESQESRDKGQAEVRPAKAGRRSAKSVKEADEKAAKEQRKAHSKEASQAEKPKLVQKPPRSRLERRGKKFRKVSELIDKSKQYSLKEAMELAVKTSPAKFDATVELHINLNVDPKQADQNIRGTVVLPGGTGKSAKVAVLAEADDVARANKAGADIAGQEEILNRLEKGAVDFDVLIATPAVMPTLAKYARLLGPKGLMPNPKSGTVTTDIAKAVSEAKAGRLEYRVDSTGIIHVGIGKVSFGPATLLKNAEALVSNLKSSKPPSVKGAFITSAHATTTMGPSIPVAVSELS